MNGVFDAGLAFRKTTSDDGVWFTMPHSTTQDAAPLGAGQSHVSL